LARGALELDPENAEQTDLRTRTEALLSESRGADSG
jgi:hypothetical protein